MTDNPKSTNNLELFGTEKSELISPPLAHRPRLCLFPVRPTGPAPTRWWGRYPKSTNNLELFSTEEVQIICGPWAHRLRRYRFPVGPRGPAPTTSGGGAIPREYFRDYLE